MPTYRCRLLLLIFMLFGSASVSQAQKDFKGSRPPNPPVHVVTADTQRQPRQIPLGQRLEAAIQQGNLERDKGNLVEAERAYKKALTLNPNEARAYFGLGNVETDHYLTDELADARQAALQRAINYYRRVVELDRHGYDAYMALATLHYQTPATYAEAERDLKSAASVALADAKPHSELGYLYELEMGRPDEALSEYRAAAKLATDNKDLAHVYSRIADILFTQGKYNEAADASGNWVRVDPQSAPGHKSLGIAYSLLGKHAEAVEELELALKLRPDHEFTKVVLADEYFTLGMSYLKEKNKPGALEQYRKLQALGKKDQAERLRAEIDKQ